MEPREEGEMLREGVGFRKNGSGIRRFPRSLSYLWWVPFHSSHPTSYSFVVFGTLPSRGEIPSSIFLRVGGIKSLSPELAGGGVPLQTWLGVASLSSSLPHPSCRERVAIAHSIGSTIVQLATIG